MRAVARKQAPLHRQEHEAIQEPKRPDPLQDPLETPSNDFLVDPLTAQSPGSAGGTGDPDDPSANRLDAERAPLDHLLAAPPTPPRTVGARENDLEDAAIVTERVMEREADSHAVEALLPDIQESYGLQELTLDGGKEGEPQVLLLRDQVTTRRLPVPKPGKKALKGKGPVPKAPPGKSTENKAPTDEDPDGKPPEDTTKKPPVTEGEGSDNKDKKKEEVDPNPDAVDKEAENKSPKAPDPSEGKKKEAKEEDPKKGEQEVLSQVKEDNGPPQPNSKGPPAPVTVGPPPPVAPPSPKTDSLPAPDLQKLGIKTDGLPPEAIAELQATLAQVHAQDQAMVASFVASKSSEAGALGALNGTIQSQISAAAAQAKARVQTEAAERKASLKKAVNAAKASARQAAAGVKATIEQQRAGAVAQIANSSRAARGTLAANRIAALAQISSLETTQFGVIKAAYAAGARAYKAAGIAVGKEAMDGANRRSQGYLKQKINRWDSMLDGPLTDNRCEARSDAAKKVGGEYQKGLQAEADKHAQGLVKMAETDLAGARAAAKVARTELEKLYKTLNDGINATEAASKVSAQQAATAMSAGTDKALASVLAAMDKHLSVSSAGIDEGAAQATGAIDAQAAAAIAALSKNLAETLEALNGALDGLGSAVGQGSLPDPEELGKALESAGVQFTTVADQLRDAITSGAENAAEVILATGEKGATALAERGKANEEAAATMATQAGTQMRGLIKSSAKGFADLGKGHDKLMTDTILAAAKGFGAVTTGLSQGFATVAKQTGEGLAANTKALTQGLRGALKDMHGAITKEANKAAAEVKPLWQSVLKWVLIIVIVIVVALVLGPFIIGAVTGAAAAMGASAAAAGIIGSIVGGAIVGAISSAATTIIGNVFDGKAWHEGVGRAMLIGALGGAVGGTVGALTSKLSAVAQFAWSVGTDVVFDTTMNLITGQFTWEGFAQTVVSSLIMNGSGNIPAIKSIQERFKNSGVSLGNKAFGGTGTVPGLNAPMPEGPQENATPKVEEPTAKPKEEVAPPPPPKEEPKLLPPPKEEAAPVATPKEEVAPPPPPKEEPKLLPPPKEEPKLLPAPKEEVSTVKTDASDTNKNIQEGKANTEEGGTGPKMDETQNVQVSSAAKAQVDSLVKVAQAKGDGAAELKLNQILREGAAGIPDGLKVDFMNELAVKVNAPENANKSVFSLIQEVVKANPTKYCNQGDPIPLDALKQAGAFSRVVSFETVWSRHMTDAQRLHFTQTYGVTDGVSFGQLVANNPSAFNPQQHLDLSSVISGGNGVGWWGVKSDSKATNITQLVDDLALTAKSYKSGAIRVSVEPETVFKAGLRKPTAFDGMFTEWVEAQPGSIFGMTGGGKLEGVVKSVPLGTVDHFEIFAGTPGQLNTPPPTTGP